MTIEVSNLSKLYNQQKAVDSISFEVNKGEIVGFLGPNGAGKSTTMKMLTCYIMPTSGDAKISGYDILDDSLEVRKSIGYLPEHNPLYTDMYVKEYLHFAAGISLFKGDKNKRIKELVEITGLGVEQHKKIGMLSKGYRQRVGLAQALLHDPEVLILDEPTTGLDPNQIVEIRKLIQEVGKEKTVLFSTHILQEVQAICSRVIIIDKGVKVADQSTESIQHQFAEESKLFVSFQNNSKEVEKELSHIPNLKGLVQETNGYLLSFNSTEEIRPSIFEIAKRLNNPIFEIKIEAKTLENIFRELTNKKTQN